MQRAEAAHGTSMGVTWCTRGMSDALIRDEVWVPGNKENKCPVQCLGWHMSVHVGDTVPDGRKNVLEQDQTSKG